ncbi:MAG TPA: hypothetical protein VF472_04300 [Burkholderiaceae bacterium]
MKTLKNARIMPCGQTGEIEIAPKRGDLGLFREPGHETRGARKPIRAMAMFLLIGVAALVAFANLSRPVFSFWH